MPSRCCPRSGSWIERGRPACRHTSYHAARRRTRRARGSRREGRERVSTILDTVPSMSPGSTPGSLGSRLPKPDGTSARPIPAGCGGTYPQTWGICLWRAKMIGSFVAASFQPDRCRVLPRQNEPARARSWTIPAACGEHATRLASISSQQRTTLWEKMRRLGIANEYTSPGE
jgi:hypothetical protein